MKSCGYLFKRGNLKNTRCTAIPLENSLFCSKHAKSESGSSGNSSKGTLLPTDSVGKGTLELNKILQLKTTENNKKAILKHYTNLKTLDGSSSEYYKNNLFIDWALKIPFGNFRKFPVSLKTTPKEDIKAFVNKIATALDSSIWGLDHVKNEIVNFIVKMITNPNSKRNILALYGSPGTGKSRFVQILAKELDLPYQVISLGGLRDSAFLTGHGYVYVESSPGKIMQSIIESGCFNGILYFDELDKVSETEHGKDIFSTLMFITDPTQNSNYRDHYFSGMTFDLSQMFFIFTFNDISKIDKVLLDRLNVIYVDTPTRRDKIIIIRDYCFSEILENIGLPNDITITDEAIEYILNCIDSDSIGIRSIYRVIEKIMMEMNKDILLSDLEFGSIKEITMSIAKEYFLKIGKQIGGITDLIKSSQPPDSMYL
jgi:ATP-dependent Lon protease